MAPSCWLAAEFARVCSGLSDPYCKVSLAYTDHPTTEWSDPTSSSSSITPPPTPDRIKRSPSILSCISSSCMFICGASTKMNVRFLASKNPPKTPSAKSSQRSSMSSTGRRRSADRSSATSSNKSKASSAITYRTEVRPKTINPEWNEHFEL